MAGVDRRTACGKRDYAILLLLVTYGLRSREVTALTLDDLDWKRERLAVPERRAGHSTAFPLSKAVGEAIVDYLQHGRPKTTYRHVFFRSPAPGRPIGSAAVSARAARYLLRAGVQVPRPGSHTLRLLVRFAEVAGCRDLDQLTAASLETFLASRPRRHPRSFNHLLGVIRCFLDWAVIQELLSVSPREVRRRRVTAGRPPFLFDVVRGRRLLAAAGALPDSPRANQRGPTVSRHLQSLLRARSACRRGLRAPPGRRRY